MRFARIRIFCQTLRFRLTLWNTIAVLVITLVSFGAVHAGMKRTLWQFVDEFIKEELHAAVGDLNRLGEQPSKLHAQFDDQATNHPRRRLFIQLLNERGALVWSSEQSPSPELLPAEALAFAAPTTVGDHRILCRRVHRPGHEALTLRVGCSLAQAHARMQRFTRMLLSVAVVVLLLIPIGGYLLAWRVTRPLAHIITTTNRLHPAQLDERLPIRDTQDELDRLSRTINQFLDRIAAYLRQSREFTANAAHELRTPLTALQSSLEIALNTDRTVEEYQDVLATLLEECGRLRVLVNQLLLLSEGDAGLRLQPLRLDQIVLRSVEMFQVVAEAAEVQLATRRLEGIIVQGDGNRLWQVVNNLLDNAIKFTPAGGRVFLDLWLDPLTHHSVLEISDTGAGIAPADLPHVFDRFYQGDRARERESSSRGLGLGLSICQAVVAAHGGTITTASVLGKGTTFTVRLPDGSRAGSAQAPPTSGGTEGRKAEESAP